ncbi:MAG: AMP nucleosidase [Pseudomonadota bacterium]
MRDQENMTEAPLQPCADPASAVAALQTIYDRSVQVMREEFTAYLHGDTPEDVMSRCVYPELVVEIPPNQSSRTSSLSLGRVAGTDRHAGTITQPELFADYLLTQLSMVQEAYGANIFVRPSTEPIPLQFALGAYPANSPAPANPTSDSGVEQYFPTPNLIEVNDDVIDGRHILRRDGPLPLSWFGAQRSDYSLYRLNHYTATDPRYFQRFVMFTNYQRYVDEFVRYGKAEVAAGRALALVEPGNRVTGSIELRAKELERSVAPQMPAYHLVREHNAGDTLVNIGVGPSNAKTITDHIAVLRPASWLMIGHCGGLRRTQQLGDYVLAHAYLRDDGVLDDVLPISIPLPTLAEIQLALTAAVQEVTGATEQELKKYLRTGTVLTTADRNWELYFDQIAERLNQSRAIAIDMESATIAANGYRFRVPYGTLLCVSDKPLHGELKLPGMAHEFYQRRVGQHLAIALRANEIIRQEAAKGTLRSRKLRSFDEALFQ